MARRKKSRSRRKSLPHPSVTGLAGGLMVAKFLNEGYDPATTVTGSLQKGDLNGAIRGLMNYAPALITTPKGREALVKGVGISALGTVTRKMIPNVKLGTSKIYMRI